MADNGHMKAVTVGAAKRIGLWRGFLGSRCREREDEGRVATMRTTTTMTKTGLVGPVEKDAGDGCEDSSDDGEGSVDPWRAVCRHCVGWGLWDGLMFLREDVGKRMEVSGY